MNGAKSTPDRARSQSGWHKVFGVLSALAMRRLTTLTMLFALAGCAAAKDEYPRSRFATSNVRKVSSPDACRTAECAAGAGHDFRYAGGAVGDTGQQAQTSHQAFLKQVPAALRLADVARGSCDRQRRLGLAQVALASLEFGAQQYGDQPCRSRYDPDIARHHLREHGGGRCGARASARAGRAGRRYIGRVARKTALSQHDDRHDD